jgi:NTP pyrophosphatase (non-canonical NTP hydrolase)
MAPLEFIMDKEREILLIAQEECAEVIQAISKCFRFGLDNVKPGKPKTNREHLEEELGDLIAMLNIMCENGMVNYDAVEEAARQKVQKLKQWSNIYD